MPNTQEQLDQLTRIAGMALESIQALERVAAAHTEQIASHTEQLGTLQDTVTSVVREWQAYLRRGPRQ